MGFTWENMFNKTSKQVKDGFHEITKQVSQMMDSDLPDFPKNNRPWGCKCGTIVDSKYDFCPKCGTSKKEIINSFLEKQSLEELEESRKRVEILLNENQQMKQKINSLNEKCSDLQNRMDSLKNKIKGLQFEYDSLKEKYSQLKNRINAEQKNDSSSANTYTKTPRYNNRDYTNISYMDYLHDVYDNYNKSSQSYQDSLNYFNAAVDQKRAGRYSEAIDLQVQSIQCYLFDPEIPNNFYSMAKTYYLMNRNKDSLNCYRIYLQLCILKSPDIAKDLYALNNGAPDAAMRLNMSFWNLFKNMGHAMLDERNKLEKKIEIEYYRSELVSKPLNDERTKLMSEQYDKELARQVAPLVFDEMQEMVDFPNKTLPNIKDMMLHYSRCV